MCCIKVKSKILKAVNIGLTLHSDSWSESDCVLSSKKSSLDRLMKRSRYKDVDLCSKHSCSYTCLHPYSAI